MRLPRLHRPHPLSWRVFDRDWRKTTWDHISVFVVIIVIGVGIFAYQHQQGQTNHFASIAATSSKAAAVSSKAAATYGLADKELLKRSLIAQHNNHLNTLAYQAQVKSLLQTIITYAAEISAAQQDHAQTLDQIAALQQEVANVISALPAADTALEQFAATVLQQLQDIKNCVNSGPGSAACSTMQTTTTPTT